MNDEEFKREQRNTIVQATVLSVIMIVLGVIAIVLLLPVLALHGGCG